MNVLVLLFFVHCVLATVLLGGKFANRNEGVFKSFGIALLLDAVAFAAWTFGVIRPESLLTSVTIGAICFLASLVFLLRTSAQDAQASTRQLLTAAGIALVLGIFYVGRYVDPADAFISPEGFLFFNLQPLVQMLYIFGLTLAALPAIDMVASKFRSSYSALVRWGFVAQVAAGVVLITSNDTQSLYITGWIVGIVYVALWGTLLFNRNAWPSAN